MTNFIVTVLDTTGIQPYIFGSNRLRENIGASYLVSEVTNGWVKKALEDLTNRAVYFFNPDKHDPSAKPHIEDGELIAELVYAGGGNTVLLFSNEEYAKEFTRILSERVLRDAPGISLIAAHRQLDWDNEYLYDIIQSLMKEDLDAKKQTRIPSSPLLGLSVTTPCQSTQLPAIGMSDRFKDEDEASYPISREIEAKLRAISSANERLSKMFSEVIEDYQFPLRTDWMGRSEGESSYVAIIHADGNSMGKRFQDIGKGKSNRDYITAIRKLSHDVNQAGLKALKEVIEILVKSIQVDDNGQKTIRGKFKLNNNNLPFRPLVYGGDDVTFVCDGRLGLELATIYLEALEKQSISYGGKITACAGISITKTHYPFARAYQLSEELCRRAKKFLKEEKLEGMSALDWHIASSGLTGSLSEIRNREYREHIPEFGDELCPLEMRPIRLKDESNSEWRNWEGFKSVLKELNEGKDWKGRRNKVVALRDVLRRGSNATQEFLRNHKLDSFSLPSYPDSSGKSKVLARDGWLDRRCGYFDAIEAMDFYISLRED
jgi:hypothetical protein